MRMLSLLIVTLLVPQLLAAQTADPQIRDLPRTPVRETDDPVNRYVAEQTVDGLVLSITIDGTTATLDQAVPARVRKVIRKPTGQGDFAPVTVVGFANGVRVSEATVSDSVIRALDDWNVPHNGALVRVTRRQLVIPLAAPQALDTIEVTAPATGARVRLDVRAAYADYCRAGQTTQSRKNPMCPQGGDRQQQLQ